MNFLAHLALADGSPDSLTGNFLGDFVKGRPEGRFAPDIVRGIRLHRHLDTRTDSHPAVIRAVDRMPASKRRHAWIAVDMAFDHFLAREWEAYMPDHFARFREHAYTVLRNRTEGFPERAGRVAQHMTTNDWLGSYADMAGIETALSNMSRRLRHANPLAGMAADIHACYAELDSDFADFWPDIRAFAFAENRRLAQRIRQERFKV